MGIESLETASPLQSQASTLDRTKRGPMPGRRKKCSPRRKIPRLIMFRTRFALSRRIAATSATVRYSSPQRSLAIPGVVDKYHRTEYNLKGAWAMHADTARAAHAGPSASGGAVRVSDRGIHGMRP